MKRSGTDTIQCVMMLNNKNASNGNFIFNLDILTGTFSCHEFGVKTGIPFLRVFSRSHGLVCNNEYAWHGLTSPP